MGTIQRLLVLLGRVDEELNALLAFKSECEDIDVLRVQVEEHDLIVNFLRQVVHRLVCRSNALKLGNCVDAPKSLLVPRNSLLVRLHHAPEVHDCAETQRHLRFIDTLDLSRHEVVVLETLEFVLEDVFAFAPLVQVVNMSRAWQRLGDLLEIRVLVR